MAFVYFMLTDLSLEPDRAEALEPSAGQIHAGSVIEARVGEADGMGSPLHLGLAIVAREAFRAGARVGVDSLQTQTPVLTRVRVAFVRVVFAPRAFKARHARAVEIVASKDHARAVVQTGRDVTGRGVVVDGAVTVTVVAAACRVGADVDAGVECVLVNLADDAVVAVLARAGKGVLAVHAQPAIQTQVLWHSLMSYSQISPE
jgi:hypothetical protein